MPQVRFRGPHPALKCAGQERRSRWTVFADHCYLWGIGREAGAMESVEKDCGHPKSDSTSALPGPWDPELHSCSPFFLCCLGFFFCLGLGLCLPCPSTPSSQSEMTHHGKLAALFPQTLPLGPSLFGRQNLRLFSPFKCNLALQERERKRWLVM